MADLHFTDATPTDRERDALATALADEDPTVVFETERLVLTLHRQEPLLVERGGLLVVSGTSTGEIPDHRRVREERIGRLSDTP